MEAEPDAGAMGPTGTGAGEAAEQLTAPSMYRHALPTRLSHWLTALCIAILVPSGLQIFNAHPALYWGDRSDRDRPLLSLAARTTASGELRGFTVVRGHPIDTTGVLGASSEDGQRVARGFPAWATLPSVRWLAMGRRWHLFFAWIFVLNGLAFALWAIASRHFGRDLLPSRRDLSGLGRSIAAHVRFRFSAGKEAARYNALQKIAYLAAIGILGPLAVLTGLAMSPWADAAVPALPTLLGGRQSARTIHFVATLAVVGFIAGHVFMVAVTGFANNVRSMITGWYRASPDGGADERADDDRSAAIRAAGSRPDRGVGARRL
jgi:thiosulfate reductase cytochrome b subunit